MNQSDLNGLNWTKLNKVDQIDKIGPKGLNRNKVDRIGPNKNECIE